jgi:hypothetical protein
VFSFARPQISQLDEITFNKDVLWFNVPVEYTLSMHEFDRPHYLEHIELYLLKGKGVFFAFEALIKIHVHEFED